MAAAWLERAPTSAQAAFHFHRPRGRESGGRWPAVRPGDAGRRRPLWPVSIRRRGPGRAGQETRATRRSAPSGRPDRTSLRRLRLQTRPKEPEPRRRRVPRLARSTTRRARDAAASGARTIWNSSSGVGGAHAARRVRVPRRSFSSPRHSAHARRCDSIVRRSAASTSSYRYPTSSSLSHIVIL